MATQYYVELKASIPKLRRHLLPRTFDPTGTYRNFNQVHLRSAAFRLLCHAEIEVYIESICERLTKEALGLWSNKQLASMPLISMLGFSGINVEFPTESKFRSDRSSIEISNKIKSAHNRARTTLNRNNGIREYNVLQLLLSAGLSTSDLNQTLLDDLNNFGAARGNVAHTSSFSLTKLLDPESEFKQVSQLVTDLGPVDQAVERELHQVASLQ